MIGQLMRVVQAIEHVTDDAQRVAHGHRAPHGVSVVYDPAQRGAGDKLHGNPIGTLVHAHVMDLHHVGVVQQRLNARLVQEHGFNLAVTQQFLGNALEHHALFKAARPHLSGQIDLRHAASCQQLRDLVATHNLRGQCHARHATTARPHPKCCGAPVRVAEAPTRGCVRPPSGSRLVAFHPRRLQAAAGPRA